MKVKVRVNIHGIFSVSSASLVEVQKSDESEEPMETEQANDKEGEVGFFSPIIKCPVTLSIRIVSVLLFVLH